MKTPRSTSTDEQLTQQIKNEKWSPSPISRAKNSPWYNLNTPKVENTEGTPAGQACFRLEEVESCVQDKSVLSFLPPPGDEEEEKDPLEDPLGGDPLDTTGVEESGFYENENIEDNEPSTSAQARERDARRVARLRESAAEPTVAETRQELSDPLENGADDEDGEAECHDPSFMEPKPFPCHLCTAKFPRKLLLSAHIEKRHGVKYVFTERGKKVKLVRMPQIVKKGDKLDPFVQVLLNKNAGGNKSKNSNEIMVQPVDPNSNNNAFAGVAEELDPQDVFKNVLGDDAQCGILVDNVDTDEYIEAGRKGEVPIVAIGSVFTENHYLLRIIQLNEQKQILVPATPADIKNTEGILAVVNRVKNSPPSSQADQNGEQENLENGQTTASNSDEAASVQNSNQQQTEAPPLDASKLTIVACADVMLNKELRQFQISITSPIKDKLVNLQFITFEEFRDLSLLCKPKRLRCLSELYANEGEVSTPEATESQGGTLLKPKRKYTRRNYGKENQAKAMAEAIARSEALANAQPAPEVGQNDQAEEMKTVKRAADADDDEDKDATYSPSSERRDRAPKKKRRTYIKRNLTPARKRLNFDTDSEEEKAKKEDKETTAPSDDSTNADSIEKTDDPAPAAKIKIEKNSQKEKKPSSDSDEKDGGAQPRRKRGRPAKLLSGL